MEGRPIALVEDGDMIEIDEERRELNLLVEPEVLLVRRGKWEVGEKKIEPRVKMGTLGSVQSWCGMQVMGVSPMH